MNLDFWIFFFTVERGVSVIRVYSLGGLAEPTPKENKCVLLFTNTIPLVWVDPSPLPLSFTEAYKESKF